MVRRYRWFFLALSYFGTDQSQVGRYLTAKDIRESRLGLLMNGLVKIPMQFLILLIGALLFSFYTIYKAPLFFNESAEKKVAAIAPAQYFPLSIENKIAADNNQRTALDLLALRKAPHIKDDNREDYLVTKLNYGQRLVEKQEKDK